MKKWIPFVSPVVFGLFGGLLVVCGMCVLSIQSSPFSGFEWKPFFSACLFISILSALFLIVTAVVNIVYWINLEDPRKTKRIILAEVFVGIVLFFISWSFWNAIVGEAYTRFYHLYVW